MNVIHNLGYGLIIELLPKWHETVCYLAKQEFNDI